MGTSGEILPHFMANKVRGSFLLKTYERNDLFFALLKKYSNQKPIPMAENSIDQFLGKNSSVLTTGRTKEIGPRASFTPAS